MPRRSQMTRAVGPHAAPAADVPDPQTADEKTVQFINAEVLDPPSQGSISFVGPFLDQSLAMAVEDARSFVQGAEQILLVALAKALEKYLSGGLGEGVATSPGMTAEAAGLSPRTPPAGGGTIPGQKGMPAVDAIHGVLASLSRFHGEMAETALKHRRGH
jgi:hypothetical protein